MEIFLLVFELIASPKSRELPLDPSRSSSFYICWMIILENESSFDDIEYYIFSVKNVNSNVKSSV